MSAQSMDFLDLKPGDTLVLAAPDEWNYDQFNKFESYFRTKYAIELDGIHLIILPCGVKIRNVVRKQGIAASDLCAYPVDGITRNFSKHSTRATTENVE